MGDRIDVDDHRVLAVELYADGVIARFLVLGATDPARFAEISGDDPVGRVSFSLDDDLGTAYRWSTTGSTLVLAGGPGEPSGGKPILRGDAVFVPAVPAEATQLTIVTVEGLVEVPLAFV